MAFEIQQSFLKIISGYQVDHREGQKDHRAEGSCARATSAATN